MLYEIIITHRGVPCETWEAEAESADEAIDICRADRIINDEHDLHDTYDALPAVVLTDDDAHDLAFYLALRQMPALWDRLVQPVSVETFACT